MNKKAISCFDFLCFYKDGRLVLTSGIKDNWDAQRHIDYIVGLHNGVNADKVQFLLTYTGQQPESVEVIVSLETTKIIGFNIKSIEEIEREFLAANWQCVLSGVHDMVVKNNPIEDSYIETMLVKLKPFDRDVVESLVKIHENNKSNR